MKIQKFNDLREPKICDYVICKDSQNSEISEFTQTHIGYIVNIEYNPGGKYPYEVQYKKMLPDRTYGRLFDREEILYYSTHSNDLEIYITANKYNL